MAFPFSNTTYLPFYGSIPLAPSFLYPVQSHPCPTNQDQYCQRCADASIDTANLRNRIAVLDTQLMKVEKEKAEAEVTVRHLLQLNFTAGSQAPTGNAPTKEYTDFERRLYQVKTEKDCARYMLERALKRIVDLTTSITSHVDKSSPLIATAARGGDGVLGDLLDLGEAQAPLLCNKESLSKFNISDDLKSTCSQSGSIDVANCAGELKALAHDFSQQESDSLSDSSYIFHFVRDRTSPLKGSNGDDKIIMMKEKAPKAANADASSSKNVGFSDTELGSDGDLTAVNSASSSLFHANAGHVEAPNQTLVPPVQDGVALPPRAFTTPIYSNDFVQVPKKVSIHTTGYIAKDDMTRELPRDILSGTIHTPVKLYDSETERQDVINAHRRQSGSHSNERKYPDYFKHGLQYNPAPGSWNTFRTLLISDLPQEATMTAILDQVKGGVVVDAKLLNTSTITGGKTALVTFLHERSASALVAHAENHPITLNNQTARVSFLKTPTWPDRQLSQKVVFDGARTRCLEVSKYPRRVSPSELRRQLRVCSVMKSNRIEFMELRDNDVLSLRFTSTTYAGQAHRIITAYRAFRGCVVQFAPDPCAQPLGATMKEDAGGKISPFDIAGEVDKLAGKDGLGGKIGRLSKVE